MTARGGELRRARCVDREAWRGLAGNPFHEPSRSQIPICIPFRNEPFLGIVPGVAGASLGNPGLGYAFPTGMVRPGGWSAREGLDRRAVGGSRHRAHIAAISVPASHTSGSVALDFLSTHRSPSLFVAVAQQNTAGAGTSLKDLHILALGCHGTWLPRVTGPRQNSIL